MPDRAPSDPFARFVHAGLAAMALSLLLAIGGGGVDAAQPSAAEPAVFASTPMPYGVVESEVLTIEPVREPAARADSDAGSSGLQLPRVSMPTLTF